jgi:hypothetical protein
MALTPSEAAALANRLGQELVSIPPAALLSRLIILDNPLIPGSTSTYPSGIAFVSADGTGGILVNIAKGPGGAYVPPSFTEPPKILGIDIVDFKLFVRSGGGLIAGALRSIDPADFSGVLPAFENINIVLDGSDSSVAINALALNTLVDTLNDYFNGLVGAPADYARTVAELRGLLNTQAPVAFNDQRQAVGTEFRDVLTSRGDGRKEVLTGFLGADAFYIKELDFLTGKNKLNTKKVVTSIDDYNAQQGDHVFVSLSELQKMAPGFSEIKFATAFTKSQLKKLARSGSNFIYYTGSGDLYFDANGSRKDFGRGGQIARFDLNEGLRPFLSSADFSLV